jgi:hypothetical protein
MPDGEGLYRTGSTIPGHDFPHFVDFSGFVKESGNKVKTAPDWADDLKTRSILTVGGKVRLGWDESTEISLFSGSAWMRAKRQRRAWAKGIDPDSCAGNGAMSW